MAGVNNGHTPALFHRIHGRALTSRAAANHY
jgi:hypothetical protein